MQYCDSTTNVLEWGSEEIALPYRSPIDNKVPVSYTHLTLPTNREV